MFEFADILVRNRRLFIVGFAVTINLILVSILAPAAQTYRTRMLASGQSSYNSQMTSTYDSSNTVSNAMSQLTDSTGHAVGVVQIKLLDSVISLAKGVSVGLHGVQTGVILMAHGVVKVVAISVHTVARSFAFVGHGIFHIFGFMGRGLIHGFAFAGRTIGSGFKMFGDVTHLTALVQPKDNTPTPVITKLRIQQAALIQSDTKEVSIAPVASGIGGLCDNGSGNGGYPMAWCNAYMDSISTISYSGDHINRECTSYAYWYFTNIEGHTDFHATGNAKYWANTTNYSTGTIPVVGAIAVETAGAYGHVAIVQALPGHTYDGQAVPAGSVLVSEMNYDWNGHFRYSYSSLSKFTTYIYP